MDVREFVLGKIGKSEQQPSTQQQQPSTDNSANSAKDNSMSTIEQVKALQEMGFNREQITAMLGAIATDSTPATQQPEQQPEQPATDSSATIIRGRGIYSESYAVRGALGKAYSTADMSNKWAEADAEKLVKTALRLGWTPDASKRHDDDPFDHLLDASNSAETTQQQPTQQQPDASNQRETSGRSAGSLRAILLPRKDGSATPATNASNSNSKRPTHPGKWANLDAVAWYFATAEFDDVYTMAKVDAETTLALPFDASKRPENSDGNKYLNKTLAMTLTVCVLAYAAHLEQTLTPDDHDNVADAVKAIAESVGCPVVYRVNSAVKTVLADNAYRELAVNKFDVIVANS